MSDQYSLKPHVCLEAETARCPKCDTRPTLLQATGIQDLWRLPQFYICWRCHKIFQIGVGEVANITPWKSQAREHSDGWVWYDEHGKDYGPWANKQMAETLGPARARNEEKMLLAQRRLATK